MVSDDPAPCVTDVGDMLEMVGAVELTMVIVEVLLLTPPAMTYTSLLPCVVEVVIVTTIRVFVQDTIVPETEPIIT